MAPVILVAVDDSPRAADTLALAGMLAAPLGASLAVANVRPPVPQPWLPGHEDLREELRRDSHSVLRRARERLGDPAGATYHPVVDSSVPHALTKLAEKTGASAIVVAQTHRGRARRVAGVAERLLHGAGRPVGVAPPGLAEHGPARLGRVVAAFDGSPESEQALGDAAAVARGADASLRVVGVFDTLTLAWVGPPPDVVSRDYADAMVQELRDAMEAAVGKLPGELEPERDIVEGAPGDTLIAASREADLLVCGSRGMGPIGATLVGSVSNRLVHTAACAVLAIPAGSASLAADPAGRVASRRG